MNSKIKRILALSIVIIFVSVALITLFAAIFSSPDSNFYKGMIGLMIVLPVIAYGYTLLYRFWQYTIEKNKKSVEDMNKEIDKENAKNN